MLRVSFNPFPTLTTARLVLRQMSERDADQIFKLRSDAEALRYLDKAAMQSKAEAVMLITKINADAIDNQGITWGLALKEEPAMLIGTIGLWRLIKEHFRAEIGYMLLPEYFRKGYMTEAIMRVTDFGFKNVQLHTIEANINPANSASASVLERTGYIKEAHFRENFYFDGRFKDTVIYSIINPE